jgi:hypothetical protein
MSWPQFLAPEAADFSLSIGKKLMQSEMIGEGDTERLWSVKSVKLLPLIATASSS